MRRWMMLFLALGMLSLASSARAQSGCSGQDDDWARDGETRTQWNPNTRIYDTLRCDGSTGTWVLVQAAEEKPSVQPHPFTDIKLPANEVTKFHFTRYEGDREVNLWPILDPGTVVIRTKYAMDPALTKRLNEEYDVKKIRELSKQVYVLTLKEASNPDDIAELINDLSKESEVASASPVFNFSDGPRYLTGKIVITWGPKVSEKLRVTLLDRMGLKGLDHDDKTGITLVDTTSRSGWNVFYLVRAFLPQNGNAYVVAVEPHYARVELPISVRGRVRPADGAGYGGDIVGSRFIYEMEIRHRKDIAIIVNELKAGSETIKKWLPKVLTPQGPGKEVAIHTFSLEGDADISERDEADPMRVTTIRYAFRMLSAGAFVFTPPTLHYRYTDPQRKKAMEDKLDDGEAAEFYVARVMPLDASMVNNVVGMPELTPANPLRVGTDVRVIGYAVWGTGALFIVAGAVLAIVGMSAATRRGKRLSPSEEALRTWDSAVDDMLAYLPEKPAEFWGRFGTVSRNALALKLKGDAGYFDPMTSRQIADECGEVPWAIEMEELLELAYTGVFDTRLHQALCSPEQGKTYTDRMRALILSQ